jgi:predicted aspartyl protease
MVARRELALDQVRSLDYREALVDTGAAYIGLPTSDIARLGLRYLKSRRARTAAGLMEQRIFSPVRFSVQGRDGISEVAELPDGSPALLGQLPLEQLDFWIDMAHQKLVGNPEHGGQWMMDSF